MTFKAAIVIDNWKLPIFERHLSQAGYGYTWTPSLTANCGVMTVKLERATQAASLQPIIQAARERSGKEQTMNRIQAKKLQADIDKRAEEVVLKLQRKGIIVKPLSAPLETIALAAGATVVDGESITFSVEAWSKFRVALGAPLPQTLVLKATLRQLVDEVKRHAYAPQFQHMGPLVMEAEALLAKDAPSVPTMAAPASAPTERDDCTYPSCQCDGFAVRCPLQKRT